MNVLGLVRKTGASDRFAQLAPPVLNSGMSTWSQIKFWSAEPLGVLHSSSHLAIFLMRIEKISKNQS